MSAAGTDYGSSVSGMQSSSAREDRSLQSLHEPVGPGMPWLRPCVANAEFSTHLVERTLELASAIGQHPPQLPTCFLQLWSHHISQERRRLSGVVGRNHLRHAYELEASHAVSCHIFPTPLRFPM